MTDLLVRLLRRGYGAVEDDRRARGAAVGSPGTGGDTYASRLTGRRAVVVRGPRGAELFYDESLMRRRGAIPFPLRGLLFGVGAVHGLDGDEHKKRKLLFLETLRPEAARALVERATSLLEARAARWTGEVRLFDELVEVYGTAVIGWAGLPCSEDEAARWGRELSRIVAGFGGHPRAYPRAWVARRRCNAWARGHVQAVRDGRHVPPAGSALRLVADAELDDATAAVELLNILRPTVATAWLGAFAGLYLDEAPEWRERLRTETVGTHHVAFAQEVRRSTPFVPVLAAKVTRPTSYDGVELRRGDRVVLDVWGSDQRPGTWRCPHDFTPERFAGHEPAPFDLLAQGGGPPTGHRCPGEPVTVPLVAETARVLAGTDHRVTSGGAVDLATMPTLPQDGVRLAPR
jgi:fatty-acid peroxygenase